MSKNVILIYPVYTYPRKNPPIGLACLAAYIRRGGFNPLIVDLNVDKYSDKDLCELINEHNPQLVGISFMTHQYGECVRLAELIKSLTKVKFIAVGGPHVSALPEEILEDCGSVDFSVIGEGEETFMEILKALVSGGDQLRDINGLCFRDNGKINAATIL